MIIHLDMDGVLADFERGFEQLTGRSIASFTSRTEFWEFAGTFDRLYADLPMMPDAQELMDGVRYLAAAHGYKVEILTALPSRKKMPHVAKDKELWIKSRCPYGWKFKTGPYAVDKQKHAKPGEILIDDKILNITQWNQAGGIGILHETAAQSLERLRGLLR